MRHSFAAVLLLALGGAGASTVSGEVRLGGFGEYTPDRSVPCVTEEQRAAIRARLEARARDLEARGGLRGPGSPQLVLFGWPLRAGSGLYDYGFHGISNFVDHNPGGPGALLDYHCGTRTYDLAGGYDHAGTDLFTWPFGWHKMDNDQVEIVAVAPGVILGKDDGHPDRSCGFGAGNWNAVYVRHADNSVAWYGHMKTGSLTPKAVGEGVAEGEYLGVVGSSGNSTGPHLHLEVYDEVGNLLDPWAGACNPTTAGTWWQAQRPYYDSAVNALMTHDAPPSFPACPATEIPNASDLFVPGQTIYFAAYYRDQLQGQVSGYTVFDANGAVVDTWSHSIPAAHYAASYWYWYGPLPANAPLGEWKFQVVFEGATYEHRFQVQAVTATETGVAPLALSLASANPSRGDFAFDFSLPAPGPVRIEVFDAAGRRLAVLAEGAMPAGRHRTGWDARAQGAPAGFYVARLTAAGRSRACKIAVVK